MNHPSSSKRSTLYAIRYMRIENPTLAHFRHFSSLFTLSPLYICREPSTNQLLFMQNKPNFRKAKMNISNIITRNYKVFLPLAGQKNKPNSNPISSKAKIACRKIRPQPTAKHGGFLLALNRTMVNNC